MQDILIVTTIVLSVFVIVLIIYLIPVVFQVKKTAKEAEETLKALSELSKEMKFLVVKFQDRADDLGSVFSSIEKALSGIAGIFSLFSFNLLKKTSKLAPFVTALLSAWGLIKKIKGGKKYGRE
ncbi:MAG: DUF948 domain-containing protein [Acidobacteriota bacterium]